MGQINWFKMIENKKQSYILATLYVCQTCV